ncbi:hypothetical protein ACFLZV_00750 [Candidatus Margulisiibacteriota bacterium]
MIYKKTLALSEDFLIEKSMDDLIKLAEDIKKDKQTHNLARGVVVLMWLATFGVKAGMWGGGYYPFFCNKVFNGCNTTEAVIGTIATILARQFTEATSIYPSFFMTYQTKNGIPIVPEDPNSSIFNLSVLQDFFLGYSHHQIQKKIDKFDKEFKKRFPNQSEEDIQKGKDLIKLMKLEKEIRASGLYFSKTYCGLLAGGAFISATVAKLALQMISNAILLESIGNLPTLIIHNFLYQLAIGWPLTAINVNAFFASPGKFLENTYDTVFFPAKVGLKALSGIRYCGSELWSSCSKWWSGEDGRS